MKTLLTASIVALGLFAGAAQAAEKPVFTQIGETAPLSATFEDLNQTAPRSNFDQLQDTAPHTGAIYGQVENTAP